MKVLRHYTAYTKVDDTVEPSPASYIEKILCNKCKALLWDSAVSGPNPRPFFHHSRELKEEEHEFDLCEECYGDLISSFEIPVMRHKKCRSHY